MRYLHNVAQHETFVASGIYTYYEDGRASGAVEEWCIHQLPDGSEMIRVDHDARRPFGTSTLLEALRAASGQFERFDIQFYQSGDNPVKEAGASYTFFEDYVQIGRTINAGEREYMEMQLPIGVVIYPLMRVFTGRAIAEVAAATQLAEQDSTRVPVFLPWIFDPDDKRFLSGMVDYRTASSLGAETLEIAGKTTPVECYHFIGGPHDEHARFWLDEQDLLVRYVYKQSETKEWLTLLTQLSRKPLPINDD